MNKKNLIAIATAAAAAGVTVREYLKIRKSEELKRDKIWQDANKDIVAINKARDDIQEELKSGRYPLRGIRPLMDDLKFRTITNRFED
jgi:hypothetical protein